MRLSVTHLDAYRYYRASEDMTLEQLVARLRGEEPPSPAALAGRAFHKLLEHAADNVDLERSEVDGWVFRFWLDGELSLPPIRELKGELELSTPHGPVTLVGRVDGLHGLTVHDYKLTERFDAERYADSYQWRAYLAMFGAQRFVYDVFQGRYEHGNEVLIYDYHRLGFAAYPGMLEDVRREVCGLAEIVARHVPERAAA